MGIKFRSLFYQYIRIYLSILSVSEVSVRNLVLNKKICRKERYLLPMNTNNYKFGYVTILVVLSAPLGSHVMLAARHTFKKNNVEVSFIVSEFIVNKYMTRELYIYNSMTYSVSFAFHSDCWKF